MKRTYLKPLLMGTMFTFILACNNKKETTVEEVVVDKEQVKNEIQAKEDEFATTYNSGEAKNIGFYAGDAVSFYQNRKPLVGKDAIVEFLKSGLSSNSNKISFRTNEVFPSNDGNMVLEIGAYTVIDSSDAVINTGNYMTMFEKRDGKYVSVRDMSVSDMTTP
jgi:ketosteroid isomerase-like protein